MGSRSEHDLRMVGLSSIYVYIYIYAECKVAQTATKDAMASYTP